MSLRRNNLIMRIIIKNKLAFVFLLLISTGASLAKAADRSQNSTPLRGIALNNISMLFPLPTESLEDLPGLNAPVALFEPELFRELPILLPSPLSFAEQYRHMRLVSLRWDPAGQEARLIFQPLTEFYDNDRVSSILAEDAAIHLFYRAPDARAVPSELRKLQQSFGAKESMKKLGVHKGFLTPREVARKMKRTLQKIASWQLYKVTFMTERQNRVMWHFGGFDVVGDSQERRLGEAVEIPHLPFTFEDPNRGVHTSVQRVVRGFNFLRANVHPLAEGNDNINEVFTEGDRWFESDTEARVQEMRNRVDHLEDPRFHNPQTMDCASCHAIESTSRILERDYGAERSSAAMPLPTGFELSSEVKSLTMENTVNFRAFGYFNAEPSITRRVLLETYLFQQTL